MVTEIKVTNSVKEILNDYDADALLRTVPYDYKLNPTTVHSYSSKIKSTTPISITLTTQILDWLTAMAENHNIPFSLLFNFLIETVADCGKIHTKNIKQALDCYYYALNHNKSLFSRILEGYSNSGFYYTEETKATPNPGLNEEGIAYFLTLSEERKKYNTRIQKDREVAILLVLLIFFNLCQSNNIGSPSTLLSTSSYPNFLPASPPILLCIISCSSVVTHIKLLTSLCVLFQSR